MKNNNDRYKFKIAYYVTLVLYIAISIYSFRWNFIYYFKWFMAILGAYLILGAIISLIYKLNVFTPKLRKFKNVDTLSFKVDSYITSTIIGLLGVVFILIVLFVN